jgi:ABC-type dipeptide/oligopeptide/nickel transport system ATPase component
MALVAEPEVLIADEPTTALDAEIQRDILDLIQALQRERGIGVLLISHDLAVVSALADRAAVMYAGELVETARLPSCCATRATRTRPDCRLDPAERARRGDSASFRPGAVAGGLADRGAGLQARCPHETGLWRNDPLVRPGPAAAVRCVQGSLHLEGVESMPDGSTCAPT